MSKYQAWLDEQAAIAASAEAARIERLREKLAVIEQRISRSPVRAVGRPPIRPLARAAAMPARVSSPRLEVSKSTKRCMISARSLGSMIGAGSQWQIRSSAWRSPKLVRTSVSSVRVRARRSMRDTTKTSRTSSRGTLSVHQRFLLLLA